MKTLEAKKMFKELSNAVTNAALLLDSDRVNDYVCIAEDERGNKYVSVDNDGINGTGWDTLGVYTIGNAVTYRDACDARYYGYDEYLVEGNGKPMKQHICTLGEVVKSVIRETQSVCDFLATHC